MPNLEIPINIIFADPESHQPSEIGAIICVTLFYKLLCVGQILLKNHPDATLQIAQLKWIVEGEIKSSSLKTNVQCNVLMHST